MISNFAFTPVLWFPLIMYGWILTLLLLLTTATIGGLINKGYRISFTLHRTIAILTLVFGLIHGFFGLAFFLKF